MTNGYYSVIIPVYNQSEAIFKKCLQSIYSTRYPFLEVIVVNDGSASHQAVVKQFSCQIVNLPEHRGSSFARNTGAKKAQYARLVFVDSDVVICENYFQKLNEFFDQRSDYCCVSATPVFDNYDSNLISQYYNLRFAYYFSRMGEPAHTVLSSCLAIKKDCFFSVSGFDQRVPSSFADDIILGWRLDSKEYRLAFDSQMSFRHLKTVTFFGLARNLFLHSYYYAKYFLIYRFSKSPYLPSVVNREAAWNAALMAMLITVFFLPLAGFYKLLLTLIFLLLILINYRRFLRLVSLKKNSLSLGFSVVVILFEILTLLCGSIFGISKALINRVMHKEEEEPK